MVIHDPRSTASWVWLAIFIVSGVVAVGVGVTALRTGPMDIPVYIWLADIGFGGAVLCCAVHEWFDPS